MLLSYSQKSTSTSDAVPLKKRKKKKKEKSISVHVLRHLVTLEASPPPQQTLKTFLHLVLYHLNESIKKRNIFYEARRFLCFIFIKVDEF